MSDSVNLPNLAPPNFSAEPMTPATREPRPAPNLNTRLTLRAWEAAAALGISERKLRQLSSRLPVVRLDGVLLYPVKEMERWLTTEVARQRAATEQTADEILREISSRGK